MYSPIFDAAGGLYTEFLPSYQFFLKEEMNSFRPDFDEPTRKRREKT